MLNPKECFVCACILCPCCVEGLSLQQDGHCSRGTHFESSEALGELLVLATSTALNCFVIEGGEIAVGDQVQLVRGRACPEPGTVPKVDE